jgi:hypothetical protein
MRPACCREHLAGQFRYVHADRVQDKGPLCSLFRYDQHAPRVCHERQNPSTLFSECAYRRLGVVAIQGDRALVERVLSFEPLWMFLPQE